MNKKSILAVLVCGVALLAGFPASAQNAFGFKMSSSFYAGNAKMPAGTYSLTQSPDDSELYTLRNTSGTHEVILESRQSATTSKSGPEVRFNRYGTTEYLEGVATASGGSVDFPSVAEKSAAKKGEPTPHTVTAK